MNFRDTEIIAPKDFGAAGTETEDIKVKDPISAIFLTVQTTVATAAVMTAPHADVITTLEVVDGSEVVFSMSGKDAQALAYYGTGKMPLNSLSVKATEYMKSVIPIFFGRKLFDPELALDPKQFDNLQINITWNEDAANGSVTANSIGVRAIVLTGGSVNPIGFLKGHKVRAYTPAASAEAVVNLPTDFAYRLLMMESYATDKNPAEVLAQFKLSVDFDRLVPFNFTGEELAYLASLLYDPVEERVQGADATTTGVLYVAPTYDVQALKDFDTDVIAANDDISQNVIASNTVTYAAGVNCVYNSFFVRGLCPHHCLAVPMGDRDKIEDCMDVSDIKSLRLVNVGAAAVGTSPAANVIAQQLRKY